MKRIASAALALSLPLVLAGCPGKSPTATPPKPPVNTPKTPDKPRAPAGPKPAPKPAMKLSDMTSPWRHARVGDWVEFGKHFNMGAYRHEITEIKDGKLFYKLGKVGGEGRVIPNELADLEKDFNPPEKLNPPPKVEMVELKLANGKTLKCKYYKREGLGSTTETWLCEDIAINGGVVKSIRNGEVQLEISDYHKVE